jgi:putative two-component system response regulator
MKKILVADDSKIISNIVTRAFNNEYEVVVAFNGKEAIDIVKNNIDDSIVGCLLDLNMPEVDGFAVLDYFKENNLFKRIPVCIITGDVAKDRIDRAFNYDIVDVLAKPFTFENVRQEVEKIINLSSLN